MPEHLLLRDEATRVDAHRYFRNYMALPPTRQPPLMGTLLAMDRHLVGLLLRARVAGHFSAEHRAAPVLDPEGI